MSEVPLDMSGLWQPATTSTRWSTILSAKVNLPDAIDFGALFGANLVTQPSDIRGNETLELHRMVHGYLAHKKTPTPLGPPQDPRRRPTVES